MKKFTLLVGLITATVFDNSYAQITSPAPFCAATFDDDPFIVEDAIKSVSFGTLTNQSNTQYAFPHYVFYNNLAVPNMTIGIDYTLTVAFDVHGGCGYGVWIDYNHNNMFEVSEKVTGTTVTIPLDFSANTIITKTVKIPATAMTGLTRMRVRIVEDDNYTTGANGFSILPCNASASSTDVMDWGETEDYNINITSATVGFKEVNEADKFVVYPNPVTSSLNINQELLNITKYKILSITGQEMQTGTINNVEKQINVSLLSEGIYFLQLFDNNKSLRQQKFVKIAE